MTTTPSWVSAFLDFAPGTYQRGVEFWRAVTGYEVSAPRGERDHFATLVPPDGDAYLRVQHLVDGPGRIHLDLHVTEPAVAAEAAIELGGHVLVRHEDGYVVVRSPGGLLFCLVAHGGRVRPRPVTWPGGRSQVDQVCLDIPPSAYDAEVGFWRALTGWELDPSVSAEFARLEPPEDQLPRGWPLRWLIQRLDDEQAAVTAHLDLSADDRDLEVERHVALGARAGARHDWWTVLTDPTGMTYCITRRSPR